MNRIIFENTIESQDKSTKNERDSERQAGAQHPIEFHL